MNKPIHNAAHYAEILRTRATLERRRKIGKPRHGLAANFDDAAAYCDMVMTQAKEITRLTDALKLAQAIVDEAKDRQLKSLDTIIARNKRIAQLEAAVRQIAATAEFPSDEAHQDCVDIAKEARGSAEGCDACIGAFAEINDVNTNCPQCGRLLPKPDTQGSPDAWL